MEEVPQSLNEKAIPRVSVIVSCQEPFCGLLPLMATCEKEKNE